MRINRLIIGLFVVGVPIVNAQDRARTGDGSERLAMYLRTGQYDDARRLIDAVNVSKTELEGRGNTKSRKAIL